MEYWLHTWGQYNFCHISSAATVTVALSLAFVNNRMSSIVSIFVYEICDPVLSRDDLRIFQPCIVPKYLSVWVTPIMFQRFVMRKQTSFCHSRFGSTLTACGWRQRWSTTCVSSVTLALWTGYVYPPPTATNSKHLWWAHVASLHDGVWTISIASHTLRHLHWSLSWSNCYHRLSSNLTYICCYCNRKFPCYPSPAMPRLALSTTSASLEMTCCCTKVHKTLLSSQMLKKTI